MFFAIHLPDPGDWITGAFKDAALAPINALANAIGDALQEAIKALATVWINLPTPNIATQDGHASPVVGFLQGELAPYVALLLVVSLLIGAGRVMLARRAQDVWDVLRGLVIYTVVAGTGTAAVGLLIGASDAFAQAIVDHSTSGGGFGRNLLLLMASGGGVGPFLVIVLAGVAVLISLVQIVLLVIRAGLLVLLVGLMPLAASFTATETGRHWLRKHCGWMLAFCLYKPVAAIVYACAFRLLASDAFKADGLVRALVGVSLMGMAIVALPALLRFMVPAASQLAIGAGGSSALMGAGMVASAIPTGAKRVPPITGAAGATGPAGAAVAAVHSTAKGAADRATGGHHGN